MADFCQQCSLEIFLEDFGELTGLTTEEKINKTNKFPIALCEGCGPCQVDHNGICVTHKECLLLVKDLVLREKYWPEGEEKLWQKK